MSLKSGVPVKRETDTKQPPAPLQPLPDLIIKGNLEGEEFLTAGGVKCKLLAMSTAGFVPKQERTWLDYVIEVFYFVSLGFFPSWITSCFPKKPQLSWWYFSSVNAPFIPIHGSAF